MHLPEPGPERAHPAKAKREPFWLELCAEIAAISTFEEWDAFWPILTERMEMLPIGWWDTAHDEMTRQRNHLLEVL